ncbi:apolipoprotein N-acyltransferase [Acetobacter peroxydans]|jgi:apolipoprotein N-acyltransferase|uniref:apolipoprotein N-acyltransferase n=1 Tax=Acetobacter peroxydans TaxID=104098 RepID=UPI0023548030|nr:apolipoprotein N-acyltransferase [Acetobacter peroxydans]MCH4142168.1 apolipoprotein N-acyltransferase [Acetobacter peroxydans]MCI1395249.1 apolipoprotein N-acyltransferase [Acetobacter peroxydans]MCI1410922.1 apolipoprotein N-acyltransferase [Acetobacter peroxydans]MCI1440339.1 apolipoprotein N-acyltransferase [Acetobacter peroxydans]MCI1566181.1 apolipoprotein N-acyltransferase [Acetobacter peroxydans]
MLGLGTLTALALPPVHFLPVLLLSFGLLGQTLNTTTSWKRAAWAGGLFGFGFYATGLYWLIHAVLIRAEEFWWFVPFPSLGCALILAPTVAAPTALSLLAPPGLRRLGAFAALWTLADMSRTFLFSGFTWNALGSCLAIPGVVGDILIQPAAWMGEDGLTLGLVLLSTLAGVACLRGTALRHRTRAIILGGSVCAVLVWCILGAVRFYTVTPAGEPGPIAVIAQGNVPETEKVDRLNPREIFRRYLRLTRDGVQQALALDHRPPTPPNLADAEPENTGQPIVFLWPETSFPGYDLLQDSPQARAVIMQWGNGADAGLIGALRMDEQGRYRNSMLALAPDGSIEDIYDKARLVPFGEYQPPFIPLQIVPQGGMAAGPGPRTLHLRGLPPVGPLICYEVIFSGDVTDRHDRPRWLANITNDAWFGNSAGPRQHLASVRLRAVEEGLPIARAANTGISAVYDGRGHLLHSLGWDQTAVFAVPLPAPLPATFFALYGQNIPLSVCVILFVTCISYTRSQKKRPAAQRL